MSKQFDTKTVNLFEHLVAFTADKYGCSRACAAGRAAQDFVEHVNRLYALGSDYRLMNAAYVDALTDMANGRYRS